MDRSTFYDNLNKYTSKHTIITSAIASDRFDFYDKLQHHGIKGQKWGVRRYQNPDGSLTDEGKQRYLNPDGSISDKAPIKIQSAYNRYKYQQAQEDARTGKSMQDNYVYDEQKQKEKLENARSKKMYDLNFVETIQNAENLSSDDVNKEYEAYLKNPRKYMQEFSVDSMGNIKSSLSGSTTNKNKPAKQETPKTENTEKTEKQLKEDLKEEAKSAFGPKATPEEESKFWKALAAEYEKGNIKDNGSSGKSGKQSKEEKKAEKAAAKAEKKEINKAKAEAWKSATKGHTARNILLTGPALGALSDWGMVNKAIKELGYTSKEKKNLSASDWNKINEKIQDMRGFNKKKKSD